LFLIGSVGFFGVALMVSSERRVSINADGISAVSPSATENVRWSLFQKVNELNGNFLLFYGPQSYYVIPKRSFTRENLEEFLSLLRENNLL
jgi:hypothetical protein